MSHFAEPVRITFIDEFDACDKKSHCQICNHYKEVDLCFGENQREA